MFNWYTQIIAELLKKILMNLDLDFVLQKEKRRGQQQTTLPLDIIIIINKVSYLFNIIIHVYI